MEAVKPGRWQSFLNSLDSPGGHTVLLMTLFTAMSLMAAHGVQSVEQFRGECIGALLYALKGTPRS